MELEQELTMNQPNADRRSTLLYGLAAGGFYLAAIVNLVKKNTAVGCVYFALGSVFLSLGIAARPRSRRAGDAEDADDQADPSKANRR
jgi:hypothetical protein